MRVECYGEKARGQALQSNITALRYNFLVDVVRENVRARLWVIVKRILRKHGYPPDKQEKATQTVIEQAQLLALAWAA
jgi:type I restriction enzyme R subunit